LATLRRYIFTSYIHICRSCLAKYLLYFDNLRLKPEDLRVDIIIYSFYFSHLQPGFFSIPLRFLLFSCVASRKRSGRRRNHVSNVLLLPIVEMGLWCSQRLRSPGIGVTPDGNRGENSVLRFAHSQHIAPFKTSSLQYT